MSPGPAACGGSGGRWWWGSARPCPHRGGSVPVGVLGSCCGFKGSIMGDEGVGGVMGCKRGAPPRRLRAPRDIFRADRGLCPPSSRGRAVTGHTTSAPHHRDAPESGAFPRQQRLPGDGEGSQGPVGCGLTFRGCPGPPSPAPFRGMMVWLQVPAIPILVPFPAWPTQGPGSLSPTDPCVGPPTAARASPGAVA